MKKKSPAHADEDAYLASQIAKAVAWTAHLRVGPHEKYTERFDGPDRYEDARAAAERLEREHSRFGRQALVFAITPRGDTHSVTPELYAMARAA